MPGACRLSGQGFPRVGGGCTGASGVAAVRGGRRRAGVRVPGAVRSSVRTANLRCGGEAESVVQVRPGSVVERDLGAFAGDVGGVRGRHPTRDCRGSVSSRCGSSMRRSSSPSRVLARSSSRGGLDQWLRPVDGSGAGDCGAARRLTFDDVQVLGMADLGRRPVEGRGVCRPREGAVVLRDLCGGAVQPGSGREPPTRFSLPRPSMVWAARPVFRFQCSGQLLRRRREYRTLALEKPSGLDRSWRWSRPRWRARLRGRGPFATASCRATLRGDGDDASAGPECVFE